MRTLGRLRKFRLDTAYASDALPYARKIIKKRDFAGDISTLGMVYLARHYIFTLTALYYRRGQPHYTPHGIVYRPTVSVLIPAHNED